MVPQGCSDDVEHTTTFATGPLKSVTIPPGYKVYSCSETPALSFMAVEEDGGRRNFTIKEGRPGSPFDRGIKTGKIPPKPFYTAKIGSMTFKLHHDDDGFIAVEESLRILVIFDGKCTRGTMMRILAGMERR
jgi:hypothetical protein